MAASISIVVPVYNSESSLPILVSRLEAVLTKRGSPFEIIMVNDGSRDSSWQQICALSSRHGWIKGINLMRNYGQHNALLCGIRAANHEIIVTIDDDLQNPPEEIPKLLEAMNDDVDVVYGTPEKQSHGLLRDLASEITKISLQSAMKAETARKVSAFRAFRTKLREAFSTYNGMFVSIDVLLTWGSARFTAVAVRNDPRELGVSNYTMRKLITHALNMITGFSVLPLQIASMLGFICTFFGLVILAYVLGRYFVQGVAVPGFAFLASTIAIFSGAQLFALGIIGEYLARMHFRLMDRPPYSIRTTT